MRIPEEYLMEVRARTDIETLVSSYVILKRTGRNLKGLCPFHSEKTPSFTVYPDDGSFYCFGCGVGGDAIKFAQRIENLDYIEAVKFLAERAGMSMPQDGFDDGITKAKRRMKEINRDAARFFYKTLIDEKNKKGLEYITSRGVMPKSIKKFGIGYAPDGWDALAKHLNSKGYTNEEIVLADLGFKNKFGGVNDRFRDRIMFPIIDLQGNIIAFGGRDISGKSHAKYVNTGDTLIYKKTNNLFAMNLAKNTAGDSIILGEGYMDVVAMHSAGFDNAVASCGTALTQEQARIIAKYAQKVIISYDADEAGQKAVRRAIPILRKEGLSIKVLVVSSGKDPDEYIKEKGAAGFKILVENALSDTDYQLEKAKADINMDSPDGKVEYLKQVSLILAKLDSPIERDAYAGKLSMELSISKDAILQQMNYSMKKVAKDQKRNEERQIIRETTGAADKINPERVYHQKAAEAEDKLIAYIFKNPKEIEYIRQQIHPDDFATEFNKRVFEKLLELYDTVGKIEIVGFSSEFSDEEYGALYRVIDKNSVYRYNRDDAEMWIGIITEEKRRLTDKEIAATTPDDLVKMMEELKKKKL